MKIYQKIIHTPQRNNGYYPDDIQMIKKNIQISIVQGILIITTAPTWCEIPFKFYLWILLKNKEAI